MSVVDEQINVLYSQTRFDQMVRKHNE